MPEPAETGQQEEQTPNPKKKGCLGISLPLAIGLPVVATLFLVGLGSGPLGKNIIGDVFPSWLSVPQPHPELPAEVVFHLFGFPITNSIVATWITIIVLAGFSFLVTRRLRIIPKRWQALLEFILGALLDFCQKVAGERDGRRFFPVVATIFLFVAFNAWLALLPGYGSILVHTAHGEAHLLRPANTDINTPLAIALVSFSSVFFFGFKSLGPGYAKKFVNVSQFLSGLGELIRGKVVSGLNGMFIGVINIFIGHIEFLSECVRIVSFTLRLFGNMTAGEILLLMATFLFPFVFSDVFYILEMLVGFVQALIFGGLTLIFLTVAVASHEH
ncbi:MAG: FoF1 ATP synthase subunit a [Dehalococcoidales bacterium]|nr:FoF1 ATP synthase subunit a [Dehalococcoidales bacterium]